ncbi:MAG: hypothetical protein HQK60_06465 [Deltaproteobacteria bacterium]|nr:hypothetical protein [Deltaproteobacteria bacterium]
MGEFNADHEIDLGASSQGREARADLPAEHFLDWRFTKIPGLVIDKNRGGSPALAGTLTLAVDVVA